MRRRSSRSSASAFAPSSQTIGSASSAVLACHHVSATTATVVSFDLDRALDAGHAGDLRLVEAHELAAEHRAVLDRRVQHAGQLDVDRVDEAAVELVGACRAASSACRRPSSRFGSLSVMLFGSGGVSFAAAAATLPYVVVRPTAACVMTPFGDGQLARPAPSTGRPPPAAASCARPRRRGARSPGRCGCRGCRRCPSRPRRACCARFSPGVGNSVATFFQSHSSSSATSCARPVMRALPHLRAGDADHAGVVGLDDDPGVDLGARRRGGRAVRRRRRPPNGNVQADARARRPRRPELDDEPAAGEIRAPCCEVCRFMACPPVGSGRGLSRGFGARWRAGGHVHGRADALVRAAAADVGHRLVDVRVGRIRVLREQRRGGHDLPGLAVAALRDVEREPRLLHRVRTGRRQAFDGDDPVGGFERARPATSTSARTAPLRAPSTRRTARRRSRTWCR